MSNPADPDKVFNPSMPTDPEAVAIHQAVIELIEQNSWNVLPAQEIVAMLKFPEHSSHDLVRQHHHLIFWTLSERYKRFDVILGLYGDEIGRAHV